MKDFAVILAGGRGERFWPASRLMRPKQFLRIISDKTMLEETISRVNELVAPENILIATGEHLEGPIRKEIDGLGDGNFFVEPIGRNTAPAIGFSAARIVAGSGDGVMFVLSSDHLIRPKSTFVEAMRAAKSLVEGSDRLVLIGIEPSRPETGYGYIELGEVMDQIDGFAVHDVVAFKEKPNHLIAQEYYLGNKHLWNSGIFVWRAKRILEEIKEYLPDLHAAITEYSAAIGTPDESKVLKKVYEGLSPISIDYGVLEKSHTVAVLRAKFTWDDVGDYAALERVLPKDHDGNVVAGDNIFPFESYESTIINDNDGAVVTFGVSDLVIVREGDIVFILHKTRIPQMRDLIDRIKEIDDLKGFL
ncbi:mannose-1-phosphate guanylyltransferase [bacterium]|nr:mannose-1-phosphate guanylyltransferase [bacterium]